MIALRGWSTRRCCGVLTAVLAIAGAGCAKSSTAPTTTADPTITVAAYPIVLDASDTSTHGITITLDGRLVTTSTTFPGIPGSHPQFQGPLAVGDHQAVVTMTSWDSLIIDVGSSASGNTGSVDSTQFSIVSNSWNLTPLSTTASCHGRVLFQGRASGSITFKFRVVSGTAASACGAPTTTG